MWSASLVRSVIEPVLAGTVFEQDVQGPGADGRDRAVGLLWCASTRDLVRRHPRAVGAVDRAHPDGCTDLVVEVDDRGRLEDAAMECLDLGEGLTGRPIEDVLPELARRIADVLR